MRTLQEKYNAIQEGNFSKDQFLVEARMQQPQLVTRFNGYDDAVQILKNRGMIQEEEKKELASVSHVKKLVQAAKDGNKSKKSILAGFAGADIKYKVTTAEPDVIKWHYDKYDANLSGEIKLKPEQLDEAKKQSITIIFDIAPEKEEIKYIRKILTNAGVNATVKKGEYDEVMVITADNTSELNKAKRVLNREIADDFEWGKQLNEAKQTKLTKKSLTDYRYKPTNDMDKYPYEQILRGLRVELEAVGVQGTPTPEEYSKALAKVSKNLAKDSIFYTNQLAGHNKKVDLHDKFVDATAKNTVDTFNGMKKIKDLKESHTGNPKDKYVVRPCKNKKEPWAVWEGEERVKGFATKEQAKEYADKQNKKQGLSESVLKEGIKNLIKKALMENEEDIYEMQGPKTDGEYKSELADYLEDNQIYGYTGRIHDIMTGPDENTAAQELEAYLEDNQIYGRTYLTSILDIYSDYPYDQHWMNQPDEDESLEEIGMFQDPVGYRKSEPKPQIYTKKFVRATDKRGIYVYDIFKNGKLVKTIEGGEGAANAWINNANKDEDESKELPKEIPGFEGTRDALDNLFEESDEDKLQRYQQYTYTLNGEVVSPKIGYYNNYIGAELDGEFLKVGIPSEDGVVQLRYPQGKQGMYTENIFKSVSLKDIL